MCLRMLHPYIPFVTEEIWQHIPHEGDALIIAQWPEYDEARIDEQAEREMDLLMELIRGIRNTRAEYNVPPSKAIPALIGAGDFTNTFMRESELFQRLANIDLAALELAQEISAPPEQAAVVAVAGGVTAYLPLAGLVDLEAEQARLTKEVGELQQRIAQSEGLLGKESFVNNAPEAVVQKERDKLSDLHAQREALEERLGGLG